jgi:hypothetical protein
MSFQTEGFMASFFDFPAPVRQKIYAHLLAPHADENETVINYALRWNWLDNPSNTTFGGVPQIDLCRCPRQKPRTKNIKTEDHMYTRYKCYGPEVKFNSGREDLWVPSQAYANSKQINFLQPARAEDLNRRPNANILSTSRRIYQEALPTLYRGRNFLFITGPCPRGRYQAYATQRFFAGLSTFARAHLTAFSLTVLPHEEDCRAEDVPRAYEDLAVWIQRNLPSIQTLGISLWHPRMASAPQAFEHLFQNNGFRIELDRRQEDGWVEEIEDVESFRAALLAASQEMERVHAGSAWEEDRTNMEPKEEQRAYASYRPGPVVSGSWRVERKVSAEERFDEDAYEDGEWSDAFFAPASSNKSKDGDDWEVV